MWQQDSANYGSRLPYHGADIKKLVSIGLFQTIQGTIFSQEETLDHMCEKSYPMSANNNVPGTLHESPRFWSSETIPNLLKS
jgi:hypothetical protein